MTEVLCHSRRFELVLIVSHILLAALAAEFTITSSSPYTPTTTPSMTTIKITKAITNFPTRVDERQQRVEGTECASDTCPYKGLAPPYIILAAVFSIFGVLLSAVAASWAYTWYRKRRSNI